MSSSMQRDARERPQEMGVCAPSFCHTRYEHAISFGVHARHFVSGERRKNNADGEVCGADSLGVRGQVTAGPITSPGRPAANPHMHSAGIPTIPRVPQWNSTEPEEDRSITDCGRQRTANKGQEKTAAESAARREGREGSRERFENNSSRSCRLFGPPPTALAGCEILYTSKDGSSFRLQLLEAPLGIMSSPAHATLPASWPRLERKRRVSACRASDQQHSLHQISDGFISHRTLLACVATCCTHRGSSLGTCVTLWTKSTTTLNIQSHVIVMSQLDIFAPCLYMCHPCKSVPCADVSWS